MNRHKTEMSILHRASTPSFVSKLASRGLQPDRRALLDAINMASHTNPPSGSHDSQLNANVYKAYLHKLPHLAFCLIENPSSSSFCMACDDTTPLELHGCEKCGLTLCGMCQYLITDHLIRGDLRRLIQHVARWKLGYSQVFLEREKAENIDDWNRYGERMKEEVEGGKTQEDIDRLFEKVMQSFTAGGEAS